MMATQSSAGNGTRTQRLTPRGKRSTAKTEPTTTGSPAEHVSGGEQENAITSLSGNASFALLQQSILLSIQVGRLRRAVRLSTATSLGLLIWLVLQSLNVV